MSSAAATRRPSGRCSRCSPIPATSCWSERPPTTWRSASCATTLSRSWASRSTTRVSGWTSCRPRSGCCAQGGRRARLLVHDPYLSQPRGHVSLRERRRDLLEIAARARASASSRTTSIASLSTKAPRRRPSGLSAGELPSSAWARSPRRLLPDCAWDGSTLRRASRAPRRVGRAHERRLRQPVRRRRRRAAACHGRVRPGTSRCCGARTHRVATRWPRRCTSTCRPGAASPTRPAGSSSGSSSPAGLAAAALLPLAEARGVAFAPGERFCTDGDDRSLRLSFSLYDEATLREGARRLGAAVADAQAGRA